jgi:hypothetical protein
VWIEQSDGLLRGPHVEIMTAAHSKKPALAEVSVLSSRITAATDGSRRIEIVY